MGILLDCHEVNRVEISISDPGKVFFTENDIITAFILHCVVAAGSMHPDKLVCVDSSQVCLLLYISLRLQRVLFRTKSCVEP